jgi:DNA-binding IclR family transcriptional regulator
MAQRPISLTCRVLSVVSHAPGPMRAYDIARKLGCPCNAVRVLLGRLVDSSKLVRVPLDGHGVAFSAPNDDCPKIWDIFR